MRSLGKMSLLDLPGLRVHSGPGAFTNNASFYLQRIPLLALLTEQGNRSSERLSSSEVTQQGWQWQVWILTQV